MLRNHPLPCGTMIDMSEGECCLLNCPDPAISGEEDRKARCWLICDCKHWRGRTLFPVLEGVSADCMTVGCDKDDEECGCIYPDQKAADTGANRLRKKCPTAVFHFENVWSADGGRTWRPREVKP